jgi:hypothetical protein
MISTLLYVGIALGLHRIIASMPRAAAPASPIGL